jgi:hypothetical protein
METKESHIYSKGSQKTQNLVKNDLKKAVDSLMREGSASVGEWLKIFQIFILIGVTIFTIGQFSGEGDADIAAYIWFALGVSITWILSMKSLAVNLDNKKGQKSWGWTSAASNAAIMLPTLGTLLPLGILIFILIKVRPILQSNMNNLPLQFFWFNKLTFFLVVMQMFILNKFYENVLNPNDTNNRGMWIAAMILFSVLTCAAAVELYVIITAFITDG